MRERERVENGNKRVKVLCSADRRMMISLSLLLDDYSIILLVLKFLVSFFDKQRTNDRTDRTPKLPKLLYFKSHFGYFVSG